VRTARIHRLMQKTLLSHNGHGSASACFTPGRAEIPATLSTQPLPTQTEDPAKATLRSLVGVIVFIFFSLFSAFGQGGPPYYTNDPGTPGHLNWEINVGYMPFFYSDQSVSHTPDLDINFGIGDRIQLTYENAWLRVQNPSSSDQVWPGSIQSRSQVALLRRRGVWSRRLGFPAALPQQPQRRRPAWHHPASDTFLLPFEFSKKFGPVDVDYEIGYQFVHKGPNGWLTGLVVGHDFTPRLEGDIEFYNQGTFHPSEVQPTLDIGGRYKIHSPIILLFMAGRSLEPTRSNQSYFLGYFGIQFLLPPGPTKPIDRKTILRPHPCHNRRTQHTAYGSNIDALARYAVMPGCRLSHFSPA
jgi:hypothetical protein